MLDDFFVRALLAGTGLALVTGPTGCFIVWRRLAYFGETIAHSALLGVAISILLDTHFVVGIFAIASLVVVTMFFLERRDTLPTDTLLGLLAHGGLALGLVILSFLPNVRLDIQALLFGDILGVSKSDLAMIWLGGAAALGVLCWIWRPLLTATVSTDLAVVAGLRPERARPAVRLPGGRHHRRRHQDRRCPADRRAAGDPRGNRAAFYVGSRNNGCRCRRRGRHGCRRGIVRLGRVRYAVRAIDRGRRASAIHRHPAAPAADRPLRPIPARIRAGLEHELNDLAVEFGHGRPVRRYDGLCGVARIPLLPRSRQTSDDVRSTRCVVDRFPRVVREVVEQGDLAEGESPASPLAVEWGDRCHRGFPHGSPCGCSG